MRMQDLFSKGLLILKMCAIVNALRDCNKTNFKVKLHRKVLPLAAKIQRIKNSNILFHAYLILF